MKGGYSLTDTLIYKLSGVGPFTGSGNTTNTRMTSSLSKLNTGEVTSYPYGIDSSISVAPTHAQYLLLILKHRLMVQILLYGILLIMVIRIIFIIRSGCC